MFTLNLFTTTINTITEGKNNITLQRLPLFKFVDDLTASAPAPPAKAAAVPTKCFSPVHRHKEQ